MASVQGNPLIKWPHPQNANKTPLQNPNYHPDDFFTLCNILKDPKIQPGRPYKSYWTGIEPELGLIQAVFCLMFTVW
jgi:hypothetical protein